MHAVHFVTFLRSLKRHKVFTSINLIGLVLGFTSLLLIGVWILDELNYDQSFSNSKRLHRVEQQVHTPDGIFHVAITPAPLASVLKGNYPEIQETARISYMGDFTFAYEDKQFIENRIMAVDPVFLKLFDFNRISGTVSTAFEDVNSIILTDKIAKKYFGDEDPVGKSVLAGGSYPLVVQAVIADLPHNTHLDFEILIPLQHELGRELPIDTWHRADEIYTYALLDKNVDLKTVNEKIRNVKQQYASEWQDEIFLQPINKIHLTPDAAYNLAPTIDMSYLYIFSAIAVFLILIACINYINLTIAQAARRMKEIGIRKTIGAGRLQLAVQFLGEFFGIALIAVFLSLFATQLVLPSFNALAGKQLSLGPWLLHPYFLLLLAGIMLAVLLAGLYPAMVLASYNPIKIIRNDRIVRGRKVVQKSLVVLQFSLCIVLLLGTMMVIRQLHFMKNNQKVGFDRDQLLALPFYVEWNEEMRSRQFSAFKAELLRHPGIQYVTRACESPADMGTSADPASWRGKTEDQHMMAHWNSVDYDYIETLGLKVIQGRAFSKQFADARTEQSTPFILNRSAVEAMGVESPIGMEFELNGMKGPIVGVVDNFYFRSFHFQVEPMAMFVEPDENNWLLIKFNPKDVASALRHIENTWRIFIPSHPFEYRFVDQEYDWMYETEIRVSKILSIFSLLVLFISCIGLLGLVSFLTQHRTKEIGIRKVVGSSVSQIVLLLSSDFAKWVLLANLFAWPAGYFIIRRWLQNFAYRIDLTIWPFILSGLVALVIALLTVSFLTIRAAMANPVKSLRYE